MTEPDVAALAALRELSDRATPGPWVIRDGHYINIQGAPAAGERYGDSVTGYTGGISCQRGYGRDNAAFLVAAVNYVRHLLRAQQSERGE